MPDTVTRPILDVDRLGVTIKSSRGDVHAVRNVSFSISAGEVVGLVGESGSGKSVTARTILGLTRGHGYDLSGSVKYRGSNLLVAPEKELLTIRGREIAMVFQDPANHLDPAYTAGQAVAESLQTHKHMGKREAMQEAQRLLVLLRVPGAASVLRAYPHSLSGGMCQRVMIAAAIACEPSLLIADEATSGLDATVQASLLRTIEDMRERLGMAVLMTTHNIRVVEKMCSRILVMYAGALVEVGPTAEVLAAPWHPYTKALLECVPSAKYRKVRLRSIKGDPPSAREAVVGCSFANRCPMARDVCKTDTPPLREISPGRWSACHFAEELAGWSRAVS